MMRANAVVSAAVPVGRSSSRNSTLGHRRWAVERAFVSRVISRCTPAAMPKVSVDSSTRSTPIVPAARRIRSTMLAFSVFGNTEACDTMRRMSRPDIGLGMMPMALPGATGRSSPRSKITASALPLPARDHRRRRGSTDSKCDHPLPRLGQRAPSASPHPSRARVAAIPDDVWDQR